MPGNPQRIAVLGPGMADEPIESLAYEVGKLLGQAGCQVYCGGLSGVMEAAARGAADAGALTVGILPGSSTSEANRHIKVPVATGMGEARNLILLRSVDAAIAVGKGYGTLSEIAFALRVGIPVVLLESWDGLGEQAIVAGNAQEAVQTALTAAQSH